MVSTRELELVTTLPRASGAAFRSVAFHVALASLGAVSYGTGSSGPRSSSIEVVLYAPGPSKPSLNAPSQTSVPPPAPSMARVAAKAKPVVPAVDSMIIARERQRRALERIESEMPGQAHDHAEHTSPDSPSEGIAATNRSSIGGGGNGRALSARDRYLAEVRALMEQQKRYPSRAKLLKQEGRVEVSFTIAKDGSVGEIELSKPSAYSSLNQATLEILAKIRKFHPIPGEIQLSSLRLTVPLDYQLR